MTDESDSLESIIELQKKLIEIDPAFADLDPTDPEDAEALKMGAILVMALRDGNGLSISVTDANGHTETLDITGLGTGVSGQLMGALSIGSDDGKLSPEAADMVGELLDGSHRAEIDRLIS